MAKLPKILYIKQDRDGDDIFYIADTDLMSHVEMGHQVDIGVYRLTETVKAKGVVKLIDGDLAD